MIKGIGCDIVSINRIERLINKWGDTFLRRIYTQTEISKGKSIQNPKARVAYFAKRFAAKEAISKALGIGIGESLSFLDIIIENDENGKPIVSFPEGLLLTLADEDSYAIAYALSV